MRRKIYNKLIEWKKEDRGTTALLIEGARRVGKSYIAKEFAQNEYKSFLLIDFSNAPKSITEMFELYMHDLDVLFKRLEVFYRVKLHERDSLIIFDEVQLCPHARAAIKHLVADGRYDYIETGSLISIRQNVKDILIPSEEYSVEMYPMDFEEFLWAMGQEDLYTLIRDCFTRLTPMGEALHRRAMDLFRLYIIVGGMPQAVEAYITTEDFGRVDRVKRRILDLYRNDIRKYSGTDETRVTRIFDEIPGQLQRHEKKFRLADLEKGAKMREYSNAFFWLSDSKIINCCYNSTAPNIGLRINEDRTTLKCYLGDTGLLVSMTFDEVGECIKDIYKKLLFDKLEVNKGMLIENIVAQMLRASGHKLYFYARSDSEAENRMEIDFLVAERKITSRHNISPIEVKSTAKYTLSSLRKCITKFGQYLSTPYVLHTKDIEVNDSIVYLPLYMSGLL